MAKSFALIRTAEAAARLRSTSAAARHTLRLGEGVSMRNLWLRSAAVLLGVVAFSVSSGAQAPPANSKPAAQAKIPDLSGDWGATLESGGSGFVISDPYYKKTGTPEDDTPYQPWALAKLHAE